MIAIKNPKGTNNSNPETIDKHTFQCWSCEADFISLNTTKAKFCSRKCSSDYRKKSGWSPSKETRKKMGEASKKRWKEGKMNPVSKYENVLTKEWLEENYLDKGLTLSECANVVGCTAGTIFRYLKQYKLTGLKTQFEIQTRDSSNDGKYRDKDWLYQKYFVERLSTTQIAKLCSAGLTTIKRWLKRNGFETRDSSECHKGIKRSKESRIKQSKTMQGKGNHFYGKSHKPESMQKMMDKKAYYPYQGGRVKWYKHTRNDGVVVKLQGTWEFETARYLDKKGIKYLVHGEFTGFSYKSKGKNKFYQPDFFFPAENSYLEVKGHLDEAMVDKMNKVVEQYFINLMLWMEEDLIERDILSVDYQIKYRDGYYAQFSAD